MAIVDPCRILKLAQGRIFFIDVAARGETERFRMTLHPSLEERDMGFEWLVLSLVSWMSARTGKLDYFRWEKGGFRCQRFFF
jgi:hypothetical protein